MVRTAGFADLARGPAERARTAIVNGMTGGLLWGVGREDQILRRKKGEAAWTAARRFSLAYEAAGYPPIASRLCKWECSENLMEWYDPLAELAPLMLKATYAELNEPQEKCLAVKAFPELAQSPVLSGGLQVQAGVREFMAQVVAADHTSAVAYYNSVARELKIPIRGDADAKANWQRCSGSEHLAELADARAALVAFK